MSSAKQLVFTIFIELLGGEYTAYCLETGIVTSADSQEEAMIRMQKLILWQVEFALKNNRLGAIYHPAPDEVFEKYRAACSSSSFIGTNNTRLRNSDDYDGFVINQNTYATAS
jgi:predicted RNase H-like HicB family nuclease